MVAKKDYLVREILQDVLGLQGESHPMKKLSKEDVLAIKTSSLKGIELSKLFKVSQAQISRIRKGRSWSGN